MTVSEIADHERNQTATATDTAAATLSSSFYAALRILPVGQRAAMFEIYSFCRAVDDIADGPATEAERLVLLNRWRAEIDACYKGNPPSRVRGLAAQIRAFSLAREDFHAVIDGMIMDVSARLRAPDEATLDLYCDRVASAVGRLSVKVFGLEAGRGCRLAYHLGRALQLTNILRDLDEDALRGRLYLPRELLDEAGIALDHPPAVIVHPALGRACARLVERAQVHFEKANKLMAACPRRAVRAPRIMAAVYRRLLDALASRGFAAPRRPVRVTRARLLAILLRYAII